MFLESFKFLRILTEGFTLLFLFLVKSLFLRETFQEDISATEIGGLSKTEEKKNNSNSCILKLPSAIHVTTC